jgi:hypothetical protein
MVVSNRVKLWMEGRVEDGADFGAVEKGGEARGGHGKVSCAGIAGGVSVE